MNLNEQFANAVSPETAVVIADYPYGFRLRCTMRVWVEYKPGKGFRFCSQTSNPKMPGTVWNKPKAGTYSRVSMALCEDDKGHISHASLSEYSNLNDYEKFFAAHGPALSLHALKSLQYFRAVKVAYETACAELGIDNIFSATPDQRQAVSRAWMPVVAEYTKAGTAY